MTTRKDFLNVGFAIYLKKLDGLSFRGLKKKKHDRPIKNFLYRKHQNIFHQKTLEIRRVKKETNTLFLLWSLRLKDLFYNYDCKAKWINFWLSILVDFPTMGWLST